MPEAVFRFDASPEIGFGHAVRCSALACHLAALGWETVAAANEILRGPWMNGFGRVLTVKGEEDPAELEAAIGGRPDILVIDHYGWDATAERACSGWAQKIIVIDDLADRNHDCDVLSDSSLEPLNYAPRVGAATQLLLGPHYALLRPEFAQTRHRLGTKSKLKAERLFVNVGATDPKGLLPKIVQGIQLSGFDGAVDILIAQNAPNCAALEQMLNGATVNARLHFDVDDVAALMAAADLAIGAAGGTAWERCCIYLPSIVVVSADNQRHVAGGLAAAGACMRLDADFSAGAVAVALSKLLAAGTSDMSLRAGRLCDGLGCGRLAEAVLFPSSVTLRPADEADRDILLKWQREPATRRHARNLQVPGPAEHAAWLSTKLKEPGCVFHLIEVDQHPAGFLRLDYRADSDAYEVSIGVSEQFQGKGVATAALAIVRRLLPWADLRAFVQSENSRSIKLFAGAGYVEHAYTPEGVWFALKSLSDRVMAQQTAAPLGVRS